MSVSNRGEVYHSGGAPLGGRLVRLKAQYVEVMVELFTEREFEDRLVEQLYEEGPLVRLPKEDGDDDIDDEALMARLRKALSGGKPLSEMVIEDREDRV